MCPHFRCSCCSRCLLWIPVFMLLLFILNPIVITAACCQLRIRQHGPARTPSQSVSSALLKFYNWARNWILGQAQWKKNSGPDSNMFPDCTAQNKRTNDCVNDSYGLLGTEQHVSWNTAQCKCEHSCRLTNLQPAWSIVKLHRELTELTAMNTNLWFKTGSTMIWKALYKEGSKRFE